jgi:hypothetical protein
LSSDSSNHSLYLIKLRFCSSYPERNFRGNQLLDGSISLSPLHSSLTNDLHVSTASSFHQSFPWLHPTQAKFTIFRVLTNMLLLNPFVRDAGLAAVVSQLILSFLMRSGFSTLTLAYWLDSLVRVSRRDSRSHFGKIARRPLKLNLDFAAQLPI